MGLTGRLYQSLPCRVRRKLLRWGGAPGAGEYVSHVSHWWPPPEHQIYATSGRSGLGGSPGLGGGPGLARDSLGHTLSVALNAEKSSWRRGRGPGRDGRGRKRVTTTLRG